MEKYIGTKAFAEKFNLKPYKVRELCRAGKIAGAIKEKGRWLIPANAKPPKTNRTKGDI